MSLDVVGQQRVRESFRPVRDTSWGSVMIGKLQGQLAYEGVRPTDVWGRKAIG